MTSFLDGLIKVVVTYGFDGIPSINVHFVLQQVPASPIPNAVLGNAVAAIYGAYNTEWKDFMVDTWTIDEIVGTDQSLEGGGQFTREAGLPIEGTIVTAEVPSNVALVVTKLTDRTGRSFRGRSYLAGLSEANVFGNTVDGNTQVAAATLITTMVTELDDFNLDLVVLSTIDDGQPRVPAVATVVTGAAVNARVDTQRRRLD